MMAPNITIDNRKVTVDAVRKTPMRKSDGGRMGSAAWCSHTMKAPMNAAEVSPSPMMTGEPHAYWAPPHTVTRSAAVTPTIISPAPR